LPGTAPGYVTMMSVSPSAPSTWPITLRAVADDLPGQAWQQVFAATWPSYRAWYCRDGLATRPSLERCGQALQRHMPELVPIWHRLVELTGDDPVAARMLSLLDPPAYLTGCSQAAWRGPTPMLVRNYDYAPLLLEGVVAGTRWNGRRVVGMSDCLWGLLDGMNDSGLAVSLAFGGRRVIGSGFGIPLVVRYLLEVCGTVDEACTVLARLPVHMAYSLTLVDGGGEVATAYLGPDRPPRFERRPVATNHQQRVEWPEQAFATRSQEREAELLSLLAEPGLDEDGFVQGFLRPPLHSGSYSLGFGTLYTAVYRPAELTLEYRWPGSVWRHGLETFADGWQHVLLQEHAPAQPLLHA
jgi:predicted choloylglycine hydrolase